MNKPTAARSELLAACGECVNPTIETMVACIYQALQSHVLPHLPQEHATRLVDASVAAIDAITEELGGTLTYLPNRKMSAIKARNRSIHAEHKGHNIHELAVKHRISEHQVRRILKIRPKIGI